MYANFVVRQAYEKSNIEIKPKASATDAFIPP